MRTAQQGKTRYEVEPQRPTSTKSKGVLVWRPTVLRGKLLLHKSRFVLIGVREMGTVSTLKGVNLITRAHKVVVKGPGDLKEKGKAKEKERAAVKERDAEDAEEAKAIGPL